MFALGDRVRKVRGDCNLGATGVITAIDLFSPDGYDYEIRCDVPVSFLISGRQFFQKPGHNLWIKPSEWAIDRYDGNDPAHWLDCCWTPRLGFVKR